MEETSIVLVSQYSSPHQKEKRIKSVSRHALRRTQVNSLSGVVQEEVPVVKDYPDVFPEELPGMPPDRDIEFLIELLPGTGPISKRPYRMPANDPEEIKKQIKELLEKGYCNTLDAAISPTCRSTT